ncbi:MAG: MarR family winged helix-turn-helix transcriptional regulator [Holosporales bacterium]|jgi:DNA-binding MarR family transcriptional regulator
MKQVYTETFRLLERVHRQFLEVIKAELDRLGIQDINNVQALILFNIADDELTIGELTNRGYYLGSNVSYNVRKMVENGYLEQQRSAHDKRSIRVKLTKKGLPLYNEMNKFLDQHTAALKESSITAVDLKATSDVLRKLERFWGNLINFQV